MDPEEEVQRIEHDLSYEEKGTFAELCQGRFRKAGIFVVGLGFLVQIPGPGLVRVRLRTCPRDQGNAAEAIRTYWYNGGRWPEETST